jgi:hypothetical protein
LPITVNIYKTPNIQFMIGSPQFKTPSYPVKKVDW